MSTYRGPSHNFFLFVTISCGFTSTVIFVLLFTKILYKMPTVPWNLIVSNGVSIGNIMVAVGIYSVICNFFLLWNYYVYFTNFWINTRHVCTGIHFSRWIHFLLQLAVFYIVMAIGYFIAFILVAANAYSPAHGSAAVSTWCRDATRMFYFQTWFLFLKDALQRRRISINIGGWGWRNILEVYVCWMQQLLVIYYLVVHFSLLTLTSDIE